MKVTLTYQQDKGISLNDTVLSWGLTRARVRELLGDTFKENNSSDFNIIQRRDIYQNYQGKDNYFLLNYDKEDCLRDIEIHNGLDIVIQNIKLDFEMDFQVAISLLQSISLDNKELLKELNHGKGVIRYSNPDKIDFEIIRKLLADTVNSGKKRC